MIDGSSSTIEKIKDFVLNENYPDTLYVKEKGDLVLLNYKPEVQFGNLWTDIEIACRGLIINRVTGEIVARPFDKFFNWGENNRTSTSRINHVSEKMDGSLVFNYRHDGKFKLATRGSFDSPQAKWAEEFLKNNYSFEADDSWTLMFEAIYPGNRVVVDYHGREDLVLLGIRDRFTGQYLRHGFVEKFAKQYGLSIPKSFSFPTVPDIIDLCQTISPNEEGYVVEFEDGQRFKFKGEEYKKIHKMLSSLSFKFVLENHQKGTLNHALEIIPDEFKAEVNQWIFQVEDTISKTTEEVEEYFLKAPKSTRKEFALWVKENTPDLFPYMFAKLDGKDYHDMIYKFAFKEKQ